MKWTVLSKEQKLMKRKEKIKSQFDYETQWHKWFAWIPKKISGTQYVWLETVERKLEYPYTEGFKPAWSWSLRTYEYREPE